MNQKQRDLIIEMCYGGGWIRNKTLEKIPFRKPGHGPCCTCQTCGYSNDGDCVCTHNATCDEIQAIFDAGDSSDTDERIGDIEKDLLKNGWTLLRNEVNKIVFKEILRKYL